MLCLTESKRAGISDARSAVYNGVKGRTRCHTQPAYYYPLPVGYPPLPVVLGLWADLGPLLRGELPEHRGRDRRHAREALAQQLCQAPHRRPVAAVQPIEEDELAPLRVRHALEKREEARPIQPAVAG